MREFYWRLRMAWHVLRGGPLAYRTRLSGSGDVTMTGCTPGLWAFEHNNEVMPKSTVGGWVV